MPRVSSVPLVSDIRSCWTSRVSRVRACLPCRVRHAVSQSRVCCVKEAMSDMSPMSAVYQDGNWVIRKRYQLGGSGVDCSRMASTVSAVSAFKAVSACRVDYFGLVSYARSGRVADEHRFFVSCLKIATGSGPCRVRPRHSCYGPPGPLTLLYFQMGAT